MRLLIAGASGFIGEQLLDRLGDDHEVYAMARSRPRDLRPAHTWIESDFMAADGGVDLARLPESIDGVIHLALSYRHREFPESAADLFAVNTASVAALLDYARVAGASRFIYGSTGALYATTGKDAQREDSAVVADAYWTVTKYAAEQLVMQYASHFDVWIPRLFFPYGATQNDRLIPNLIASVRDGRATTMNGDAEGMVIAPIHVDDVVAIVLAALDQGWTGITNVAGPQALSLREIVVEIGRQLGVDPVIDVVDGAAPPKFDPDLGLLDSLFGLDQMADFAAGLAKTLQ